MSAYTLRRQKAVNTIRIANMLSLHKYTKAQIINTLKWQSGIDITERSLDRILADLDRYFFMSEKQKNALRPKEYKIDKPRRRGAAEWEMLCWAAPIFLFAEVAPEPFEEDLDVYDSTTESPFFSKTERQICTFCSVGENSFTTADMAKELDIDKKYVNKLMEKLRTKCNIDDLGPKDYAYDDYPKEHFIPHVFRVDNSSETDKLRIQYAYHKKTGGSISIYDFGNFQISEARLSTSEDCNSIHPRWLVPLIDAWKNQHPVVITTPDGQKHQVSMPYNISYDGTSWMFGCDADYDDEIPYAEGISCVEILTDVNANINYGE